MTLGVRWCDIWRYTVAVAVGVGLGAPRGLTGQLKISIEAIGTPLLVVAACQPDVIGAVGISGELRRAMAMDG